MILRLLIPFLLFILLSACQEREFLNQFDPKVPKTLSTSVSPAGSGQITISPSAPNYKTGETLSLTPVPSQHWVFQKWEGDASGTTVPLSLTMDSNKSLIAVFVKKDYALSITIQGGGTISETIVSSPSGREYPHGTTVRLTPISQQGWVFESWGGDLSGTDFPKNIFVDKEKNVTAKFIQPAIASLSCTAATNNGLLTAGFPAAGVNSEIPYTVGNGSAHNGQTVTSTGITGLTATLAPGTFANGNGSLTYAITGTPSGVGTASFTIIIGNQTCALTRTVNPVGSISSLNCGSATNTDILTTGSPAAEVNNQISYTGGNGNAHAGQTVTSTGVTGLTATLAPGTFANGSGTLLYTITGTPASSGTADFAINIGGQTCTISRTVGLPAGLISSLNCASASNTGTLLAGNAANGVSTSISYSGANGGTHNGQTVSSSGVTGLTATLAPGTFANGSGSLLYTITGTPASSGTANFAINIGGQTCTISRTINAPAQPTYPAGSVFCASGATVIVEVTNPKTGRTWMDRNLGATRAANSRNDTQAYGDLYQWGRRSDGHQCRNSATTTVKSTTDQPSNGNFIITGSSSPYDWRSPQNTNLWQGVNGVNNPCPSGYRLPSQAEFFTEVGSWSTTTSAGAFASPLKLPMAGVRFYSDGSLGGLDGVGATGYYWSSTVSSTNSRGLGFDSSRTYTSGANRASGLAVRCLKD